MRRTSGDTAGKVGKAMIHDSTQAPNQLARKAAVGPRPRRVEIIETIKVMTMESTSDMTTDAKRAGSLRTAIIYVFCKDLTVDHENLERCI
jgi:hypothetical protein